MTRPANINHRKSDAPLLSAADEAIIAALERYAYLSSTQVCRLLYSPVSLSWAQSKLKRLADLQFIQRIFLPRPSRAGSAPAVFTLARKGLRHLQVQGIEVQRRYRPGEEEQRSYPFMNHTLAMNDVLISLELLCRRSPSVRIQRFLHERALKRDPARVQDGERKHVAVIPDAWVSLALNEVEELPIAFELDRATEDQWKWRRKVRCLAAWSKEPYIEKFQTTALTIAVIATPGEKRLRDLLRWTERELTELGQEPDADLFRFVGVAPDAISGEELFLTRRWLRPFGEEATPLFEATPPPTSSPARPPIAIVGI